MEDDPASVGGCVEVLDLRGGPRSRGRRRRGGNRPPVRGALRGRGGAGFPTGIKWSFFPADAPGGKYLVCNGDEMEPGTYKDRQLLLADPHQLVEGMVIAAYAMQTPVGYIFLRYAYEDCAQRVEQAIEEAVASNYLGRNILGSGFDLELHVHRSAGRYILGEETALLNGLEGRRPNPRSKPPFPAQSGLFGKPTNVNNVETLANVPHILANGVMWFDVKIIDGVVNGTALSTVGSSFISGIFDLRVVDGAVNLVARIYDVASHWFRRLQVGFTQGYAMVMVFGAAPFAAARSPARNSPRGFWPESRPTIRRTRRQRSRPSRPRKQKRNLSSAAR